MKKKEESYITKSDLDKRINKTESKLIGMMVTMENRIMNNTSEAIALSEKRMEQKIDTAVLGSELRLMEVIREFGNRIIEKFNSLDERYVTRKEFLEHKCQ
jgi:hypothetical protein